MSGQVFSESVLKCPYDSLCLTVGTAVANCYPSVCDGNAKASHELGKLSIPLAPIIRPHC